MMAEQPMTDKEWEAHYDAETLARAEAIKNDPARLAAAQKQAAKITAEKKEEAEAMAKVAGKQKQPADAKSGGQTNPFNVGRRL